MAQHADDERACSDRGIGKGDTVRSRAELDLLRATRGRTRPSRIVRMPLLHGGRFITAGGDEPKCLRDLRAGRETIPGFTLQAPLDDLSQSAGKLVCDLVERPVPAAQDRGDHGARALACEG